MSQINDSAELLESIYRMMEKGDFQNAGRACETLTSRFPDFAEGWVAAAEFFLRVSNPQRALELVLRAVKLNPENTNWVLMNARCLMESGKTEEMLKVLAGIASKQTLSPHQHNEIGMLQARIDDHATAQEHYRAAVAAMPDETEFLFNLATSQRFLGDAGSAENTLDKVLSIDPTDHEAAAMRSSLRKQSVNNNHVSSLKRSLADGSLSPTGQVSLCYALSKELEDLEAFDESFAFLKRGADLRRSSMGYRVATDVEIIDQIIRVFDKQFFSKSRDGHANGEPIFIIGLPRSGTTLLERILGSHSSVYAAGELGVFGIELTKLTRRKMAAGSTDRRQFVTTSAKISYRRLGENYLAGTRPLTGSTAHFTDKLPFNYLYAGLIRRALPQAKIISLRRHPMDSCYSMYKQLFRDAYPFSYSLQDLASYYLAYHRLMEHWEEVMPGAIHTVRYEELVRDTESQTRRLLAHCGLDWENRCLEFHKNRSASTTASATQVRQKVYSSSVGKWRAYESQLAPLRETLEGAGFDFSST